MNLSKGGNFSLLFFYGGILSSLDGSLLFVFVLQATVSSGSQASRLWCHPAEHCRTVGPERLVHQVLSSAASRNSAGHCADGSANQVVPHQGAASHYSHTSILKGSSGKRFDIYNYK